MNQNLNFRTARAKAEAADPIEERKPLIAGYKVGNVMGVGPLGKIYRAAHAETGQRVVFRGFSKPESAEEAKWEAAKNQFRDLLIEHQRVEEHLNIQKILAFGEEDGLFWIATEWFEARTLNQILTDEGAQPLRWTLNVFKQVAKAVDSAGERGLSHTDLTPYNILLVKPPANEPDRIIVKVINFGLAHARKKYGSRFAAPEQMNGIEGDRRSDVYAVGALLYETLTGVPLHDGATPEDIVNQARKSVVPPIPDQPEYVQKILAVMMNRDPRFRYANVAEAIEDLEHERIPAAFTAQGISLDDAPESVKADKEISLQSYRLSDQDVVIIRNRMDTARQDAEELARERRARSIRRYVTAGVAATLAGLSIHAATLPDSYRRLRVAAITGSPMILRDGAKTPLHVGDEITDEKSPQIITGTSDSVTLTARNARLLVEPDSALEIGELNYKKGGLRRFELKQGFVLASVPARQRAAIFEIDAAGARTQIKSGEYALFAAPNTATAMSVATLSGNSIAAMGDTRLPVPAGKFASVSNGNLSGEQEVPDMMKTFLQKAMKQAMEAPGTPAPIAAILDTEEKVILPAVEGVKALINFPTRLNDSKARTVALSAMQAVCTFAGQGGESESPNKVNLSTLEPLSVPAKDRDRILGCFESGKLLSYRRLSDGGYEFLAKADDSEHTLIRGRNGKARIAGIDDLEDANAASPITALMDHANDASSL